MYSFVSSHGLSKESLQKLKTLSITKEILQQSKEFIANYY